MKLVCSQNELSQHLGLVGRAITPKQSIPILSHVLLEASAEKGTLALTGFDLSLGIRSELAADVTESGSLTVPGRLLTDIISRLPSGDPVSLSKVEGDPTLAISCFTGQYQVRGLGAEEYPALPEITSGQEVPLTVEHWLAGISQTLFAASTDESKQILTGVHIKLEADTMAFAATDGHRLATVQIPLASPAPIDFALTIPSRTLRDLERILGQTKAKELVLAFDSNQVRLVLPQQILTSRLLDGLYPNYSMLIPTQFERQVTLDRKALVEALERIAIFAEQKNNIVRFTLSNEKQTLHLSVDAPDVGTGQESLVMQMTGTDLEIGFNVKYLLDGLKVMNTQTVKIYLNGNTQPAVWQPVGGSLFRYLVMPVFLRN